MLLFVDLVDECFVLAETQWLAFFGHLLTLRVLR